MTATSSVSKRSRPRGFRFAQPLAAAALFALLWGCSGSPSSPPEDPSRIDEAIAYFGLPLVASPGNPITPAGVALGRRLFYDPILSDNRTVSCASCHRQEDAFSDAGKQFSSGSHGDLGGIHAPAIINPAWSTSFFWNGRAPSLEAQAAQPVPNPIEMNLPWAEAIQRLLAHPEYPGFFRDAFGTTSITQDLVTKAIGQFERTLISMDSPYDKAQRGEGQLSLDALNGLRLYFDESIGDCFHCHGLGPIFDNSAFPNNPKIFANNGLDSSPDPGQFEVTGLESDRGEFKVPTIRNLGYTAPYMHDGRFETLEEVIRFYNTGIHYDSPNMDVKLGGNAQQREEGGLPVWTDQQIAQMVAFLQSLNDPYFVTAPEFSDPFK